MTKVTPEMVDAGERAIIDLKAHHGQYPPHTLSGIVLAAAVPLIEAKSAEPSDPTREDKITDRGFRHAPFIPGVYGGGVRVYESSAASGPHVWVLAQDGRDERESIVHLPVDDARMFADDINRVCDRHYQTHSPDDERTINEWARARAESVVGVVDPSSHHERLCPHTTHPFPATCEGCTQVRRVQDSVRRQIATDVACRPCVEPGCTSEAKCSVHELVALIEGTKP